MALGRGWGSSSGVGAEARPQERKFLAPKDQDERWSQWPIFISFSSPGEAPCIE